MCSFYLIFNSKTEVIYVFIKAQVHPVFLRSVLGTFCGATEVVLNGNP